MSEDNKQTTGKIKFRWAALVLTILITVVLSSRAAAHGRKRAGDVESLSLSSVRQMDGLLAQKAGFHNTLETRNWHPTSGREEVPRLAPQVTAVGVWSDSFGQPGTFGDVYALSVDDKGNIYAGGDFDKFRVRASNIVKWDGAKWSALGRGVNGTILTLAVDASGSLYAGGEFTRAGGARAMHIAKWNGI